MAVLVHCPKVFLAVFCYPRPPEGVPNRLFRPFIQWGHEEKRIKERCGGMPEKEVVVSPEGFRKLEQELEHLKSVRRREVAERIKQAREFGDISENSEYEDAKNEQAFIEGRILTLEKMLRNARILDQTDHDPDVVGLGSTVRLKDFEGGSTVEYTIVGSAEANPGQSKISNESPLGKAILGHRVGSTVEVTAPGGILRFEILEIVR